MYTLRHKLENELSCMAIPTAEKMINWCKYILLGMLFCININISFPGVLKKSDDAPFSTTEEYINTSFEN